MSSQHEQEAKKKGRSRRKPEEIEEIQQRMMVKNCPSYCNKFICMLEDNCNQECEKLDMAKALICELCDNPCETEKQKILMLDMKYYDQKKKEFSKTILDGVHKVKERHSYLETRYNELKKEMLETSWYKLTKKLEIKKEGSKIRFEMELLRQFMEWLEIPYKKVVDLD